MRHLVVPAAAAAALLPLSVVPAAGRPAGVPTGSAPVVVPGERPCHFLRVAASPDVDPRFVLAAPFLGGPPAMVVPDRDGGPSAVVVPPAAAPEPTPVPIALGGETCHPAPALVPLQSR